MTQLQNSLKWPTFENHISQCLNEDDSRFSDVTLVSDDLLPFQAHKFVLSACSKVLKGLLDFNHPNPTIYMRNIHKDELGEILHFIYMGEVRIKRAKVERFFKIATELKLKNLIKITKTNAIQYNVEISKVEDSESKETNTEAKKEEE